MDRQAQESFGVWGCSTYNKHGVNNTYVVEQRVECILR